MYHFAFDNTKKVKVSNFDNIAEKLHSMAHVQYWNETVSKTLKMEYLKQKEPFEWILDVQIT